MYTHGFVLDFETTFVYACYNPIGLSKCVSFKVVLSLRSLIAWRYLRVSGNRFQCFISRYRCMYLKFLKPTFTITVAAQDFFHVNALSVPKSINLIQRKMCISMHSLNKMSESYEYWVRYQNDSSLIATMKFKLMNEQSTVFYLLDLLPYQRQPGRSRASLRAHCRANFNFACETRRCTPADTTFLVVITTWWATLWEVSRDWFARNIIVRRLLRLFRFCSLFVSNSDLSSVILIFVDV